jgi:hypothetical protein
MCPMGGDAHSGCAVVVSGLHILLTPAESQNRQVNNPRPTSVSSNHGTNLNMLNKNSSEKGIAKTLCPWSMRLAA